MATSTITRDGYRLALHDRQGEGRPVVFQHGLCGDARQTFEAFPADPAFRLLTLECRGHGASDFDPAPGLAVFAEDVAEVVRSLGGPVPVGGISMGAAIALRLAVAHPGLVSHLVLVRPAWDAAPEAPANLAPNAEVGDLLQRLPPDQARQVFLASDTALRLRRTSPDNLASLTGFFSREPVGQTATLLTALSREPLGLDRADLGGLRVPTLVCGCPDDDIHPEALARDLAASIPGAVYRALPSKGRDKAAHLAALGREITAFLKET